MKKTVAIVRCGAYKDTDVLEAVKKSIGLLGGIDRFVKKGERILVKPNLLAAKPVETAVTTHPAFVKAVILLIKEAGATPVVGDSPGMGSAQKVAQKSGILDICRETGAELIELKELVVAENPGGHTFRRLEVSKEALGFDGIINLPKLKTHVQMYLTLGVKNMFGCVPGKLKPQWHLSSGVDSKDFAGMLLDLYYFLSPRLTIMDGIVAMEGNGPGSGDPRALGLVFASENAVAMDTVIARVLGCKASSVPILKAAIGRGLKESDISNIAVCGESMESVLVHGFRFPPLTGVNFADKLPYFLDRHLRKALTSRPHIDKVKCSLCKVCVEVCPPEVMSKSGQMIDINYDRCIRCYCCQEMCPQGAITAREGWLKRAIPGL